MNREEIIDRYSELCDETNYNTAQRKRIRGKDFEYLLRDLLEIENLEPKGSFRPDGEEMDGSFLFNQRTYLLEAKWQTNALAASSIYQFKGKVDGKLVGTIGIFISMSGFSTDCVDALMYGKLLNIVLFDRNDFEKCLHNVNGFSLGLSEKLRAAAESGLSFYPLTSIVISEDLGKNVNQQPNLSKLVIVAGGHGDHEIISFLAKKILELNKVQREIIIRTAGGKLAIAGLANAFDDFGDGEVQDYMLVADADGEREETERILTHSLNENLKPIIVLPDPGIEIWFQEFKVYDRSDMIRYASTHNTLPSKAREYLLNRLNIDYLRGRDSSFTKFYNAVLGIYGPNYNCNFCNI